MGERRISETQVLSASMTEAEPIGLYFWSHGSSEKSCRRKSPESQDFNSPKRNVSLCSRDESPSIAFRLPRGRKERRHHRRLLGPSLHIPVQRFVCTDPFVSLSRSGWLVSQESISSAKLVLTTSHSYLSARACFTLTDILWRTGLGHPPSKATSLRPDAVRPRHQLGQRHLRPILPGAQRPPPFTHAPSRKFPT